MQLKGLRAAVADASAKAEGILAADKENGPTLSSSPSAAAGSARDKATLGLATSTDAGPKGKNGQRKTVTATAEASAATALRGGKSRGGGQTQGGQVSTWAHARAALLLRTEAVAVALQWVACSKMIQVS